MDRWVLDLHGHPVAQSELYCDFQKKPERNVDVKHTHMDVLHVSRCNRSEQGEAEPTGHTVSFISWGFRHTHTCSCVCWTSSLTHVLPAPDTHYIFFDNWFFPNIDDTAVTTCSHMCVDRSASVYVCVCSTTVHTEHHLWTRKSVAGFPDRTRRTTWTDVPLEDM